jgi:hypothetical protein
MTSSPSLPRIARSYLRPAMTSATITLRIYQQENSKSEQASPW